MSVAAARRRRSIPIPRYKLVDMLAEHRSGILMLCQMLATAVDMPLAQPCVSAGVTAEQLQDVV